MFPGLDWYCDGLLDATPGRVIVADSYDPDRIRRQGVEGLRRFVARRGVCQCSRRATAVQVVEAARMAGRLPADERQTLGRMLAADLSLLPAVDGEIARAEGALAEIIAETPARAITRGPVAA